MNYLYIFNIFEHKFMKNYNFFSLHLSWGNKFVIVGSQALREKSLFLPNAGEPGLLLLPYCLLEVIGRSRYNGEITAGKLSLLRYVKDSASIFYARYELQNIYLNKIYK